MTKISEKNRIEDSWDEEPLKRLFYTPEQVSQLLHMPISSVRAMAREGRIPRRKVGRRVLFEVNEFAEWARTKAGVGVTHDEDQ